MALSEMSAAWHQVVRPGSGIVTGFDLIGFPC